MEKIDATIIDAIGKLSIEVIAILALGYVIYLMAKAVNKLADSHQILAQAMEGTERATDKIGESNDRLVEMVNSANQLNIENIKVTRELVESMRQNKCPAVAGRRS